MYRTENWKELIVKIAGEFSPVKDSRESWLFRAARNAKISKRQASKLFYGQMTDPKWSLGILVKNAAAEIDAIEKARTDAIEKARLEAAKLTTQYLQIVTVRGSINVDENLLGKTALEVLDTARLLGGCDLPGNHRITIKPKGDAT